MYTYSTLITNLMMRHFKRSAVAALFCGLAALSSCRQNTPPDMQNPAAIKSDMIAGTWRVNQVVQYDYEARIIQNAPQSALMLDITNLFPFSGQTITFNVDNQGRPTTYTTNAGGAPVFFLPSGNWNLEHPVFSSRINLSNTTNPRASFLAIREVKPNRLRMKFYRFNQGTNLSAATVAIQDASNVVYEYELVR